MTEAEIIQAARDVLGANDDQAGGERAIGDEALLPAMAGMIRTLNKLSGTADARREVILTTTPDEQDYVISTAIADDVLGIEEVVRTDAYVGTSILDDGPVSPVDGRPIVRSAAIPWGYQTAVRDEILAQARARVNDQFDFEVVYNSGGDRILRLMPCPHCAEAVLVIYTTTGNSIATLPDEMKTAAVYGTVVIMLDAQINRFNSQFRQIATSGPMDGPSSIERLKALQTQRDRYSDLFTGEMTSLR